MTASILKQTTQPDIRTYYSEVRDYTTQFCQPLEVEDYVPQPVPFASPPKWHLAHTTWFFEEFVLKKHKVDYTVYNDQFSYFVQ